MGSAVRRSSPGRERCRRPRRQRHACNRVPVSCRAQGLRQSTLDRSKPRRPRSLTPTTRCSRPPVTPNAYAFSSLILLGSRAHATDALRDLEHSLTLDPTNAPALALLRTLGKFARTPAIRLLESYRGGMLDRATIERLELEFAPGQP